MKRCKAHSLTGRISKRLMRKAFKAVKKNRGAPGIDKVSINMFERNLQQNLDALMKRLKRGTYIPYPLRRKFIPKGRNKFRPLGIPAVRDRVAQEVIRRLIEPYFEPYFSKWSFGFRPGRSCHQAVREIIKLRKLGYTNVLDADIKSFFDNIPHDLIMKRIAEKIADGNILKLIQRILNSGVMEEGEIRHSNLGTPQGGVISPLLANIVLDIMDEVLATHGLIFVRYADDFLVLAKSKPEIEKAYELVRDVVEGKLRLKLAPDKTKLTSFTRGFDFLGFHFYHSGITIKTKAVENFKDKIRTLTIRKYNFSHNVIDSINAVNRGFANYFDTDFSDTRRIFRQLDEFTRRRLRCMKTKRFCRTDNRRLKNNFFFKRGLKPLYITL